MRGKTTENSDELIDSSHNPSPPYPFGIISTTLHASKLSFIR